MDTTDQKLAQALQREVHVQMSLDAERRCNESLRKERDALAAKLQGAEAVLKDYGDETNWGGDDYRDIWLILEDGYRRAYDWLTLHAQQTKAPLVDPEAEAEQAKEAMLEDR